MNNDFNENTPNSEVLEETARNAEMKPEENPAKAEASQPTEKEPEQAKDNAAETKSENPYSAPNAQSAATDDFAKTKDSQNPYSAEPVGQPPVSPEQNAGQKDFAQANQSNPEYNPRQPQYGYIPTYGAPGAQQFNSQNQPPVYGQYPLQPIQNSFNTQTTGEPHNHHNKGSKKGIRVFCIILAAVVVISSAVTVGYFIGNDTNNSGTLTAVDSQDKSELANGSLNITVNSKPDSSTEDNGGKMSISEIFDYVSPSIVEIYVYNDTASSYSYSSGIILSSDGYIITNDHIYEQISNPTIYVSTSDGRKYKATFVAGDARRDLSVIKINASDLKAAVFGKSSELVIGEDVYAIGNPAQLENSITNGIVSSLDRRVTNSDGYSERFIQTNAAISNGSSGGALVNEFGQVVGITSSKYISDNAEGICFAIPIDSALEMAEDLLANGKCTTRAKLGIRYTEINVAYGEINSCPVGLMIYSVNEASSLYNSGVAQGDIITQVNNTDITASSIMLDVIEEAKPNDTLTLTIWSASTGQYGTYTVTLLADEGSTHYNELSASSDSSSGGQQPLFPEDGENSR